MRGRAGREVAGADLPPTPPAGPRRPALTWCPLPGRPAAGTVLFSGPGPAVRPGSRRRAPQAASFPRGGDAGGAVTMETAEAAAAREAAFGTVPGGRVWCHRPGALPARLSGSPD